MLLYGNVVLVFFSYSAAAAAAASEASLHASGEKSVFVCATSELAYLLLSSIAFYQNQSTHTQFETKIQVSHTQES